MSDQHTPEPGQTPRQPSSHGTEGARIDPAKETRQASLETRVDHSGMPGYDMAGKKLGEFRLLKEIGRGGMGVVYEAIQESLNRTVAVKILPAGLKIRQEFIERFDMEAKAVARLHHPNIMTIYGYGYEDGTYYFAMEYILGKSLEDIIRENGTVPVDKCVEYALQIGNSLKYAHENGVIHRDIKPGNILIESSSGRVIVTDFGIAKVMYGFPTSVSATVLGTPEYMSPEQASGEETDQRTDVYALGLLMYQMLTGVVPFHSDSFLKTIEKVKFETLIPPSRYNPKVADVLEFIILKAMERTPENRYQSVEDLVADLQTLHEGRRPKQFKHKRQLRRIKRLVYASVLTIFGLFALVFAFNYRNDPVFRENVVQQSRLIAGKLSDKLRWLLPYHMDGPLREVVKLVEAEDANIQSGGFVYKSDYASNGTVMHMGATGVDGEYLTHSLKFTNDVYDASIEIRYSDTVAGNKVLVYFDNTMVGEFDTQSTTQNNPHSETGFGWSPIVRIGYIPKGLHEIQLVFSGGTNGVYVDYLLVKGNVPQKIAPVQKGTVAKFPEEPQPTAAQPKISGEPQTKPAASAPAESLPVVSVKSAPAKPAKDNSAAEKERKAFEQLKKEILEEQERLKQQRQQQGNTGTIQSVTKN